MLIEVLNCESTFKTLELLVDYQESQYPTRGGLLLFGKDRDQLFPDPIVRLARFEGITKTGIIDQAEMKSFLLIIVDEVLAIQRNTSLRAKIESARREDIPEYPPAVSCLLNFQQAHSTFIKPHPN